MFLMQNALRNIGRQRGRYRVLMPLLLVCALLTGVFTSVAVPCRMAADRGSTYAEALDVTDEEVLAASEREDRARRLGESATLLSFSVLLVGAVAVLYVSSIMIGERMFDVGILYAVGLSRGQIFWTLFLELFAACTAALVCGLAAGRMIAGAYLRREIAAARLPEGILSCMGGGVAEMLCLGAALLILLIPIGKLTVRLMRTNPTDLLAERK